MDDDTGDQLPQQSPVGKNRLRGARRGKVGALSRKTSARRGRVGTLSRKISALRGAGCLSKEGRAPNPCSQHLILFPQDSKPVGAQLFPAAEVFLTGEEFLPGEKTGLIIFIGRAQEGLKMEFLPLQLTGVASGPG